jgi:hypothetical protein
LSTAYDTDKQAIANAAVVSAAKNSDGMVLYKVKHTYAASGIYKVTIYGRKYWRIDHEGCDPDNLLCRALTPDLPIASNFTNLSSYCNTCRRLFDIDLAYYTPSLRQRIDNFSGTFTNCFNLRRVEWFGCTNYAIQGVPKIFYNCQNATTIKYKLPTNFGDEDQGIKSAFGWCKNLTMDIGDLFPSGKFAPRKITVGELFRRCAKLYGTVPADKLWNDTSIEWVDTANAFEGCSAAILAQVPKSWGGTNSNLDAKMTLKLRDTTDYTAFEVYASDVDITTTTKASDIDERFIPIIFRKPKSELTADELNSTPVKNNIIANKTHTNGWKNL